MNSRQFLRWMEITGCKSARDVSDRLKISHRFAQDIVQAARAGTDPPVKPTVALAMSAVAQGLKPWDEYER
jgi:hypothetical protein